MNIRFGKIWRAALCSIVAGHRLPVVFALATLLIFYGRGAVPGTGGGQIGGGQAGGQQQASQQRQQGSGGAQQVGGQQGGGQQRMNVISQQGGGQQRQQGGGQSPSVRYTSSRRRVRRIVRILGKGV